MLAETGKARRYRIGLVVSIFTTEILLLLFYRELAALRNFSPAIVAMVAVGIGLLIYCAAELVRRRFRPDLRLVFLMMTVVAIGLALATEQVSTAVQQRRLVDAVTKLGGTVQYDSHGSNDPGWLRTRTGMIVPKWLARLCGQDLFQDVWSVSLVTTTDEQVTNQSFGELDPVTTLYVNGGSLSKQGTVALAKELRTLSSVEHLSLYQAVLPAEVAQELAAMPVLKTLVISARDIQPGALAALAESKELTFIRFDSCKPMLADLRQLRRLESLKTIALYDCGFTKAELLSLEQSMPDKEFWHEFDTIHD